MPSKFSCRQLRETGQCFENFLAVRGLDMETDRERLRTIYNQDFKTRYGPAHSPAPNRGPSLPPRPPRRGHPSRPGARRNAAPPVTPAGPGAAQHPLPLRAHAPPAPPAPPGARPLCQGRAPAPSPSEEPPGQPAPPTPWDPAGERGAAPMLHLRGCGWGTFGVGEGSLRRGPGLRGNAGRELPAGGGQPWRELYGDLRPLLEGLHLRGFTIPES